MGGWGVPCIQRYSEVLPSLCCHNIVALPHNSPSTFHATEPKNVGDLGGSTTTVPLICVLEGERNPSVQTIAISYAKVLSKLIKNVKKIKTESLLCSVLQCGITSQFPFEILHQTFPPSPFGKKCINHHHIIKEGDVTNNNKFVI